MGGWVGGCAWVGVHGWVGVYMWVGVHRWVSVTGVCVWGGCTRVGVGVCVQIYVGLHFKTGIQGRIIS